MSLCIRISLSDSTIIPRINIKKAITYVSSAMANKCTNLQPQPKLHMNCHKLCEYVLLIIEQKY